LQGNALDVIEIDAASNRGIDDIRSLRDNVRFAPIEGKAKIYVIDEVHMLTSEAFNALLKTLEEPPAHAYFCLATTNPQKVPSTILSRCQRFDFRRVSPGEIAAHLSTLLEKEGLPFDREALDIIARKADGSVRDSLSLLDQVIAFSGGTVSRKDAVDVVGDIRLDLFFRAIDLVQTRSLSDAFRLDEELALMGTDPQDYLSGLMEHLVHLTQVKAIGVERTDVPVEYAQQFSTTSEQVGEGDLVRILQLCSAAHTEVKRNFNPRTRLQLLLMKLATFERSVVISDLLSKLGDRSHPAEPAAPKPPAPAPPVRRPAPAAPAPTVSSKPVPTPTAALVTVEPVAKAPVNPPSDNDLEILDSAKALWEVVCEELALEHNHRARMIRHGAEPSGYSNGVLKINCQTSSHLDMAKALLGPLKEAYSSKIGTVSIDLVIGPLSSKVEPEADDETTALLKTRWGARPA
jgi:DNA polymerase-3 subunit gamma/tau